MESTNKNDKRSIPLSKMSTIDSPDLFKKSSKDSFINYDLLIKKDVIETRNSYYNKLYSKNYLQNINSNHEVPKLKYNSIIIFDWDDTLFCTSYLENKYNISVNENIKINENEKLNLLKLEEKVFKILHLAINSGDTYIVTNSSEGWVNYVTNIFYPLVYKFLINSNKIKIISARKLYENEYPNNQSIWKLATFINISKLYNKNILTNIMCFGDSNLEIEAINRISPLFKESYIKAIMFMQNPNILQLNKQLKLCLNEFTKIHSLVKNISIKVIKKD
jgi:hypothetical protein